MVSLDTEVVNDLKSKVNIADLISQYVALSRIILVYALFMVRKLLPLM